MLAKERKLTPVDIIISQTDVDGNIIYANPIFYKIAGYSYGELIGESHNIIRHSDMPKAIFKSLWERLKKKEEVYSFIKNRCKDEDFYWVIAYIRPSIGEDGMVRNYISTRKAISLKAKAIIEPLYQNLLTIERTHGVEFSQKKFEEFIEKNRYGSSSINEVIKNIQY
jgi:PAS domain S-box-containing protein